MYKKERRIMSLSQIPFTKVRRTDIACTPLQYLLFCFVLFCSFFFFFSVSFFFPLSCSKASGLPGSSKFLLPFFLMLPFHVYLWVNVGKACESKGFLARLIDEQQLSEFPARPDSSSSG